jgi:Dolichyl-phosphate-mannose-protein mannosyltransferase
MNFERGSSWQLIFVAILLAAGAAFAITFTRGGASGHALINTESFTALAFLMLVFVRSRPGSFGEPDEKQNRYLLVTVALTAVIVAAYWSILSAPFLYDDYTHITDARNATLPSVLSTFGPEPHKPGLFYRPFGFLIYWLNFQLTGIHPRGWHFSSLVLHGAACFLLYAFCRQLSLSRTGSVVAAVLFALNASSAEAVAWIDARFDPMTTTLVLACLVLLCRFISSGRVAWMLAALVVAACAMCTKESAFCLPLMATCIWFFRPADDRGRLWIGGWIGCGSIAALAAALFVYRWWALGGIGGYRSSGTASDLNHFQPIHTLNAIFVRDWTILFFPMNWSVPPGKVLTLFLVLTPMVFAACAWWGRLPRRAFLGSLALTLAAALPVQHLLLIDTDLSGARIVYLLSVGWAVMWGILVSAIPSPFWRASAIAWVLSLNVLMLRHNLAEWIAIPAAAQSVCETFAKTVNATEGPIVISGVPSKKSGVVFLHSGFAECLEMNGHVPLGRVQLREGPGANFTWNDATGKIEPVR